MTTRAAQIGAQLAKLPGGVGCRHLARERDGLGSDLLVALGLVRPIVSRVPRCSDHGCPLADICPHRADFEPEAKGNKAGVKYRPTPAGLAATADPMVINEAVRALPAADEILALLASGVADLFQLHSAFITRARQAARNGETVDNPALSRITLSAVLDLLAESGSIERGPDGSTGPIGHSGQCQMQGLSIVTERCQS